eukprot:Nitzschia sp. Nitz4//scaffold14_size191712//122492//125170//NITZ4_001736-RA/size191712-processed-gene-0.279-mRNA-1//1//CDS//3329536966//5087//frame0
MFQWAQSTFDKLSQTVAPPPTDGVGRFVYAVQRGDENTAMGCIAEMDPVETVVNPSKGQYPIHLACQHSLQRLIQLLMNQPGQSITCVDSMGNTPLHCASMSVAANGLDVVKLLIGTYGASVLDKNAQGQTPYDVAAKNAIRQYLLPIQLQAETQIALDNGGHGLPPGIDLGGLRIQNSAMPPPPMAMPGGGAPPVAGAGPGAGPGAAGMTPAAGPPPAQSHMYGTPSPSQPQPQPGPPGPVVARTVSAPMATNVDAPPSSDGYSRVGSSSAAILSSSKYRADGFHSSSSDVGLQKKYGHSSLGQRVVAPPPSSGNSAGVLAAPHSAGAAGPNPFAAGARSSARGQRYVAYGQVAAAPAGYAPGACAPQQQYDYASAPAPNVGMFSPPVQQQTYQQPMAAPAPAPVESTMQPPVDATATAPTTPYMPPPPYQTHNYAPAGDAAYQAPDFVSPAAATYAGSPAPAFTPQNAANLADTQSSDMFSVPSPQKAEAMPAAVETYAATEPAPAPAPAESEWAEAVDPSSGQTYYYNTRTHETSWENPHTTMEPAATAASATATSSDAGEWVEAMDPTSGQPYYYHTVTGETSWEKPAETTSATAAPEASTAAMTESAPVEPATVQRSVSADELFAEDAPPAEEPAPAPVAEELAAPVEAAVPEPMPMPTPVQRTTSTADELFAEDGPAAPTPTTPADTFAAPPSTGSIPVPAPAGFAERSISADELFGAAPAAEPVVESVPPTPAAETSFGSPVSSGQVPIPSPAGQPVARSISADELFEAAPPTEPTVSTPAPAAVNAFAPPSSLNAGNTPSMNANDLFGAAPPVTETPAAGVSTPAPATEEPPTLSNPDGLMDDIPLSPELQRPPAAAPASANEGAESLFAAIGMPPPPFSAKKR